MDNPLLSRILIPLDGSETAEAVFPQIHRILPRHESQLILMHALPFDPLASEKEWETYLRRVSFQWTNDGYPSRHILRRGLAAQTILEIAREVQATMIAMSTHGRSGAARLLLGSVAEGVLRASTLPVLVARSIPSPLSRGKLEALPVRKFLLPLDGSRHSLGALDSVLKLARTVDAHVTLLQVEERSPYEGRWDAPDETLQEAEQLLRSSCIPVSVDHRKGEPGEEILKAIQEHGIDLVAMTTHGRSGPSRWVYGSVTAEVLRSSPVPLLVVRHPAIAPSPFLEAARKSAP